VLQKFNNDDHIPINLYFLGDSSNHSGKKLKEKTLSITNQKLNVIFFEGYVELQAFKNVLSCSDVIISPLKENAIVEIYLESYGKSKTSGTLSDMITFGIPTIIQNKNENIDEVYNLVDSYKNDDELADLLELYIANPNLLVNKRKHLLKYVEREYSKKVIYQRFINFVDSKK
jgi:glycosyltransferase involved in cell wall biosynthesis